MGVSVVVPSGLAAFGESVRLYTGYALSRKEQEGLAVASIARDDPSTLPGDDPACTALKTDKQTDRQTDGQTDGHQTAALPLSLWTRPAK